MKFEPLAFHSFVRSPERGSVRACERAINHSFCCFAASGRLFKIKNFWRLQTNEQPNERSSDRKNEIAIKQMNEPSNECTNKQTNEQTNKQTNKRTNERTLTNRKKVRVSLFLKVSNYWITPIFKWSYKPKFVIYVTIDVRYWGITTSYLSVIITSY